MASRLMRKPYSQHRGVLQPSAAIGGCRTAGYASRMSETRGQADWKCRLDPSLWASSVSRELTLDFVTGSDPGTWSIRGNAVHAVVAGYRRNAGNGVAVGTESDSRRVRAVV